MFTANGGNANAGWYDSEVTDELLAAMDMSEFETNRCSIAFNGDVSDDILSQVVLPEPNSVSVMTGATYNNCSITFAMNMLYKN